MNEQSSDRPGMDSGSDRGSDSGSKWPEAAGLQRESTRDEDANRLAEQHVAVVGHVVRQTMMRVPASVDVDGLHSAGLMALVLAARSYDPTRGVPFARYAEFRVRGAVVDELRSTDWTTRRVRRQAREIDQTRSRLATALGHFPDDQQVAATLGIDADAVRRSDAEVNRAAVMPLRDSNDGESVDIPSQAASPEQLVERAEQLAYLADAIAELSPRHRRVIESYFLAQEPMAALAAEFGVTESRISQLRAEALVLLRGAPNAALGTDEAATAGAANPAQARVVARRRAAYYAAVADRHAARRLKQHRLGAELDADDRAASA